jgi:hypothetical protein
MSDDDDKNVLKFPGKAEMEDPEEEEVYACAECDCPYWLITDDVIKCAFCEWVMEDVDD